MSTSRRLAAVNLDWDHLRAVDLYAIVRSFLPSGGSISSCAVHLSEFGEKNLAIEQEFGPQATLEVAEKEHKAGDGNDKEEEEEEEEEEVFGERNHVGEELTMLKKYELNRMKYYFAVIEFDSAETAEHVYNECEGCEFEHSSNVFDLQFIPDDMSFEARKVRDKADCVDTDDYTPPEFHSKALQQTKFTSSWDERDDANRKSLKAWGSGPAQNGKQGLTDAALEAFIGSSDDSSDEDSEAENEATRMQKRAKMRQLLGLGVSSSRPSAPAADAVVEQQGGESDASEQDDFFVDSSATSAAKKPRSRDAAPERDAEDDKPSRKRRRKKKRRKNDEDKKDEFKVEVKDSRFDALYTDAQYQMDHTNPNYKTTASTKLIEEERRRRRGHQ